MTIKGKKILNAGLYGISGTGSKAYWASRSNVSENIIEDTRTTYIMKYAIYQGHSSVTWTVRNNEIRGCTILPMYLASPLNVTRKQFGRCLNMDNEVAQEQIRYAETNHSLFSGSFSPS